MEEIKHNDLRSEKHKKTSKYLHYVEHLFILASTSTNCVSVSAFTSLVCVPIGTASSAVGIKICAMITGIKIYKSIIKKKKKSRMTQYYQGKLNIIEISISKSLINSHINDGEFVSVNNLLRECNEMKDKMKNPETSAEYTI